MEFSIRCLLFGLHSWEYYYEEIVSKDELRHSNYDYNQFWLLPNEKLKLSNQYLPLSKISGYPKWESLRNIFIGNYYGDIKHILNGGRIYKYVRICKRCNHKDHFLGKGGWDKCELNKMDIRAFKLK